MKYDKDTMNSLQEAYASVNETYKGGKIVKPNRNKQTGNPPISKNQSSTTSNKKPKGSIPTGGDGTAYMGEEQDLTGITLKQKKELERQEQLKKASKKAPTYKNKIVPMKTRIEEAIEMTQQEYARTNKDFKSDDPKNPRVTRYVPGKGTVSTPVKIVKKKQKPDDEVKNEGVDKKKEMEDKMKEVEDMRSLPTRMNLIKTKLRAMGLNMSHQLKGKELSEVINYAVDYYISEEGYDIARDMGRVKPSKDKKDGTTTTPSKEMEKTRKVNKGASALERVKEKYKDQIMDVKK